MEVLSLIIVLDWELKDLDPVTMRYQLSQLLICFYNIGVFGPVEFWINDHPYINGNGNAIEFLCCSYYVLTWNILIHTICSIQISVVPVFLYCSFKDM